MEENNKGYVYILTNPSFREDWVKSTNTVNRFLFGKPMAEHWSYKKDGRLNPH